MYIEFTQRRLGFKMKSEEMSTKSLGVELCLHCGLCCKGYFHHHAVICNENDRLIAVDMGATVVEYPDSKECFLLPCPKFDGKCSVYPNRPSVCEKHQCDLLQSVNAEEIGLEKAKKITDEMKALCTFLDDSLDELASNTDTRAILLRFRPLFESDSDMRKKHPLVFLKYSAYLVLKSKYFYKEKLDQE
jgi:hypothetical protein